MSTSLLPYTTPEAIEAASFSLIDAEAGPDRPFQGRAWDVARRLIHTTADFDLMHQLRLDDAALDAGLAALQAGAAIFTDTEMARCGMTARHLGAFGIHPVCWLSLPGVAERAARRGITRSAAAVELAGPQLGGAIVAIGNAPTALLALLAHLQAGGPVPALVVAMPVGFVNAAESKALFADWCAVHAGSTGHTAPACITGHTAPACITGHTAPACITGHTAPACITLLGRKGGSPLVAATINALARLAQAHTPSLQHAMI